MKYMGSKNRIAKYILPFILEHKNEVKYYFEPFVGGANVICKVDNSLIKKGSDLNPYLIALLKALQNEQWNYPDEYDNEYYKYVRDHKYEFDPAIVGFIGFNCYGARFFEGFCRDSLGKRNYYKEYCSNLEKQRVNLGNIEFICSDYKDVIFPDEPCIVYCDPPYSNTKKYKYNDINYEEFWNWCRTLSKKHFVYISSFDAPKDFKCIWEKERSISLTKNTGSKKNIERLFTKNI
ncbi:DNA adenine methylase [Brachyspira hampsonii]|uniref:site-specific DNA-methyltransferase (adenine-specific) n=1 Tax=Brachyspira hampsonii TaxID=1287055 RepID=A0AAC9TVR2_9SPIR|nr:DNA adenine methylase [Brachyspira hampsonii]ASJ21759.1 hypothetical protein BHAMNSH16_08935 [Brachyspira hampsonii]ELV05453.1 hypothetical protein H263_10302 [Brachyspira hampsonii 30599]MBW5380740.1 DNA adenine methylase [Brachyspira hampsonii]OEJ18786.1 hypothetical protein A9496_06145 [Brachyspira hampsonii]